MELDFLKVIDEKADIIDGVANYIWDHPETAFTEFQSAARLCDVLRGEGFAVEENLAGIATAFSGTFGSGRPVIGILGEFDALSGLGQEAGTVEQRPTGQSCGHGCGHNLLGAGSLAAAMAVKRYLETTGREGTVIYFGCPGEEGGSGKAFMARDGIFDDLDVAFCWHPETTTGPNFLSYLANCQVLYKFDGIASHAGVAPHLGRSALDAVELMDSGVNYMREHMIDGARVHYAIVDAGGYSPNVVQAHAEVLYLIRAPHNNQVKDLYERVCRIAQGAALMTDTTVSHDFIKGCSNVVLNFTLLEHIQHLMETIAPPQPGEKDVAFARELTEKALQGSHDRDAENPLHYQLKPYEGRSIPCGGSTDVGDVSWVCPTVQFSACTLAMGTPGHSWQLTAQGKTPYARAVTRYAGKIMAAAAVDLIETPSLLEKAKAEHRSRVGEGYMPPIPSGIAPRPMESFLKK